MVARTNWRRLTGIFVDDWVLIPGAGGPLQAAAANQIGYTLAAATLGFPGTHWQKRYPLGLKVTKRLQIDGDCNPRSALASVLSGRRVGLRYSSDAPHPVAAQSRAYRAVAASCRLFLDEFEPTLRLRSVDELPGDKASSLADQFQQVIYRATEALDFYARLHEAFGDAPSSKLARREYKELVKRHRDHWALMCNRMKHNDNVIVPVGWHYSPNGPLVFGFGICSYQGDALAPNPKIHPNRAALGYAAELHQLFADLLSCELGAGKLAGSAMEDPSAPVPESLPGFLSIGPELARVANLAPTPMGERRLQHMIALSEGEVGLEKRALSLPSVAGTVRVRFDGDGVTRKFQIFGGPFGGR